MHGKTLAIMGKCLQNGTLKVLSHYLRNTCSPHPMGDLLWSRPLATATAMEAIH